MRSIILATTSILFLLAFFSPVNAQAVLEQCSVPTVNIENTVTGSNTHVEMTYSFKCNAFDSYKGQITRMIFILPYVDINGLKASDSYGSLDVLEGPPYVMSRSTMTETSIGVVFRKGLRATDANTSYDITVEFDTYGLISKSSSDYTTKPGDLAANTKVTIVTAAVTEATLVPGNVDFSLVLPGNAAIETIVPEACSFQANKVSCTALTQEEFDEVEITWTKTGFEGWTDTIQEYTDRLMPKVTDQIGGLLSKVLGFLNK